MEGEGVELHVCFELIWMFKNLFTCLAFGFFLCEVFAHLSRAQKPFVFPRGLFPSPPLLVFQVVLLLLALPLFFETIFLFALPPFFLRVAVCFLLFSDRVFTFLLSLCSDFFHRFLFLVLILDVLLYLSLCAMSKRTLRADE